MRRIQRILKKPNCLVFFQDEKRIVAKAFAGYEWCLKARVVPINQRIRGKATIYMLYNPITKEVYRKYLNDLKKENFCKFLDFIDKKFKEDIYLILDNHGSHKSKIVQEKLKQTKKIKLEFLPANSPELNRVEDVFSLIQKEVLNNRCFNSIAEVKQAIDRWIIKFRRNSN